MDCMKRPITDVTDTEGTTRRVPPYYRYCGKNTFARRLSMIWTSGSALIRHFMLEFGPIFSFGCRMALSLPRYCQFVL